LTGEAAFWSAAWLGVDEPFEALWDSTLLVYVYVEDQMLNI
jgi:hypothetical protein